MKKMQCEVCGSTEIRKVADDIFECQSCGIQYSKEDISKLLVEVTGKVKIDHSDRIKNLYMLARADIDKNKCGNALRYYEGILLEEPTSWEAQFYVEYIKVVQSKRGEFRSMARAFPDCFEGVLNLIKMYVETQEEQGRAIETICSRSKEITSILFSVARDHYQDKLNWEPFIGSQRTAADLYQAKCEKANNDRAARNEFYENCETIFLIPAMLGDQMKLAFENDEYFRQYAVKEGKEFVYYFSKATREFGLLTHEKINTYLQKIREYDSAYSPTEEFFESILKKEQVLEVITAMKAGNNNLAIKKYREFSGKKLDEARRDLNYYAVETGLKTAASAKASGGGNGDPKTAEDWMRMFGIFGVTPFTFLAGIFVLCFIKKAKKENGGTLSKRAKRFLIMGVCGFSAWILYFLIMFIMLAV